MSQWWSSSNSASYDSNAWWKSAPDDEWPKTMGGYATFAERGPRNSSQNVVLVVSAIEEKAVARQCERRSTNRPTVARKYLQQRARQDHTARCRTDGAYRANAELQPLSVKRKTGLRREGSRELTRRPRGREQLQSSSLEKKARKQKLHSERSARSAGKTVSGLEQRLSRGSRRRRVPRQSRSKLSMSTLRHVHPCCGLEPTRLTRIVQTRLLQLNVAHPGLLFSEVRIKLHDCPGVDREAA